MGLGSSLPDGCISRRCSGAIANRLRLVIADAPGWADEPNFSRCLERYRTDVADPLPVTKANDIDVLYRTAGALRPEGCEPAQTRLRAQRGK
jgi:hypothetical protein